MGKIQKFIDSYMYHTFSTGCYTGEDYLSFERKYRNLMKYIAKNIGAEMVSFLKGHYHCSCFFKKGEKYIYVAFADVRFYEGEWFKRILYRDAKHEKDYTGGHNKYTSLEDLERSLRELFSKLERKELVA